MISRDADMRVTSWIMAILGAGLLVALPPLFFVFPAGFQWGSHPASSHDPLSPYVFMLAAMYAALGIVLLRSAHDPRQHTSVIDYMIYSSLLHGMVMLAQAFMLDHEMLHLVGDVPMLFLVATVLVIFHPDRIASRDER